ncbi:K(+)/H(+) antiporter [Agyrium rufum]|nr:K(+)/H(+) antiporter [Agyrium rufum]
MATVTATVTKLAATITKTITAASSTASSVNRVSPQGGILEGANPSVYQSSNPIILFIIQAGIIVVFCRLLHIPLSRIKQPRVIAEVLGGVLLGPSVCGHIPGFTAAIFPTASMPNLSNVANLGLILFLFLVGLEADLRFLTSNWRIALSVGALGMALPFGLGCAIAWGLYHQFHNEPGLVPISFGVYMLFVGVAMAITAFPVLCRILTELNLLHTPVGVIVLAAGVGNDVVGWILLALCVALVNAGSGLTALWVLLVCTGYVTFLFLVVRPAFLWLLRRTGALDNGPSQGMVALTLLMALGSAFFTGIIGVHPIFGAFLIGLICPHQGGFAVKITEKVEDLVGAIFLPLYFALSGLSTNLGLLNSGITWGYVVGVIAVAFFAKVTGGTLAARLNGRVWRESFTIGALMSCKGLVELIVLNIGLQAKILSTTTFTIFVVMALVTTFITTPLTSALYPRAYQIKLEAWKRGEIDWESQPVSDEKGASGDALSYEKPRNVEVTRLLAYLRLDAMPGVLTIISLLGKSTDMPTRERLHPSKGEAADADQKYNAHVVTKRPVQIYGVRLIELTDRDSSVMKVTEEAEFSNRDAVVNTFRTFGQINQMAVAGSVVVTPESNFASILKERAAEVSADMMLIPWSGSGAMSDNISSFLDEHLDQRFVNSTYSHFVASSLKHSSCNTAIFVDRGFGTQRSSETHSLKRSLSVLSMGDLISSPLAPIIDRGHHIYMPYYGSTDDKVALRLVLQLAKNPAITATIVHFELPDCDPLRTTSSHPFPSPIKASFNTTNEKMVEQSRPTSAPATFFATMRDSLPDALRSRVIFESCSTTEPFEGTITKGQREVGRSPGMSRDLIVVGRNWEMSASLTMGLSAVVPSMGSEAQRCLGVIADGLVANKVEASLIVIKSAGTGS